MILCVWGALKSHKIYLNNPESRENKTLESKKS